MRLLLAVGCGVFAARWAHNFRLNPPADSRGYASMESVTALSILTATYAHHGRLDDAYAIWHGLLPGTG